MNSAKGCKHGVILPPHRAKEQMHFPDGWHRATISLDSIVVMGQHPHSGGTVRKGTRWTSRTQPLYPMLRKEPTRQGPALTRCCHCESGRRALSSWICFSQSSLAGHSPSPAASAIQQRRAPSATRTNSRRLFPSLIPHFFFTTIGTENIGSNVGGRSRQGRPHNIDLLSPTPRPPMHAIDSPATPPACGNFLITPSPSSADIRT
mmetsp:Transcript_15795/g.29904  ORF Transcript_15795/g.29904 Transcript_15795/m.29904 type:complete len:205 (-) Transcript_15795:42-656(-)